MQELKALKTEYSDGFWNANSVLMGGLGHEPYIDGEFALWQHACHAQTHTQAQMHIHTGPFMHMSTQTCTHTHTDTHTHTHIHTRISLYEGNNQ